MKILVLTSVFPNEKQPTLGVFVRERMFRVAEHCELKVVAPVPWFPFVNKLRKDYRPIVPYQEVQDGIEVYHPRFFNIPRYFKFLDGFFFFISTLNTLRRLQKDFDFDVIDTHFIYPDGLGGVLLGKYFKKPVSITVRGTIRKLLKDSKIHPQIRYAANNASQIFTVCEDLKRAVHESGANISKTTVVPNGVDLKKFQPIGQDFARENLNINKKRKTLISVGGLVERKGFHRILEVLPDLKRKFPDILYIIVGGGGVEGDNEKLLRKMIDDLDLRGNVLFAGRQPHDQLYKWLSCADVFCLATSNEGWANVFLEAMACGLPVVTTDVGGNPEVVNSDELGVLIPLGEKNLLREALEDSLLKKWDRSTIKEYAYHNTWEKRISMILTKYENLI